MEALARRGRAEIEIMVDFHGRPACAAAALAYIEALAPGRPMFVEEPVPPGETAGLGRGAAHERSARDRRAPRRSHRVRRPARRPRRRHHPARHLPLRRAARGEEDRRHGGSRSVGVAPHNPLGPIAGVAALHFAVSTPNHVIQEEMVGAVPWYFEVVRGPIRMVDGFWQVPEAPGLGIEVDEAACARHPFAPEVCTPGTPSSTTARSWTGENDREEFSDVDASS